MLMQSLGGRRNLAAFFLRFWGRVAAVAAKVEDVGKKQRKSPCEALL